VTFCNIQERRISQRPSGRVPTCYITVAETREYSCLVFFNTAARWSQTDTTINLSAQSVSRSIATSSAVIRQDTCQTQPVTWLMSDVTWPPQIVPPSLRLVFDNHWLISDGTSVRTRRRLVLIIKLCELRKMPSSENIRNYSFTLRVVNFWTSRPDSVMG